MSDLTNALIAAKLIGNGGGGSGSGLPPIETVEAELLNDTLSFIYAQGMYMGTAEVTFNYVSGQTYTITWDGVDYECEPFDVGGILGIGNAGLVGGTDTGEPFLSVINTGNCVFMTASDLATHSVVVKGLSQTPADGTGPLVVSGEWKFIPLALPPIEIEGEYNTSTHVVDLDGYTWDEVIALWAQRRDIILYVDTDSAMNVPLRLTGYEHPVWQGWYIQNNGTKISFWSVMGETEPAGYFTEKIATVS